LQANFSKRKEKIEKKSKSLSFVYSKGFEFENILFLCKSWLWVGGVVIKNKNRRMFKNETECSKMTTQAW
jgi:CRISPR/Cas system-associated protein Csx1